MKNSLLADLMLKDTRMDRMRRLSGNNSKQGFQLMKPYKDSLWNQINVVNFCSSGQRPGSTIKAEDRVYPGQNATMGMSLYLCWVCRNRTFIFP